ncbi:MAG TPA: DUF72 domain-containing protein [Tepidisphaeraceae bacterium]|nr:DUF72 domain-containing protein [Tepidisphaeraceae bacterium]
MPQQTRIGISGWTYGPWRGTFYPPRLPHKRELEYASRQVNSIEINGSFYSLQTPRSYQTWYEQTPPDFVFSVKGGRFITHMKKLKDVRAPLANFIASGILCLKEKLGPILWQFPPGFAFNEERFAAFFELLPRDTQTAAALAKEHDDRLKGRSFTKADKKRPLRHCVEIRHHSFKDERFIRLLRKHDIALVFADTAGRWPYMEDVTSNWIYVRLHGDEELYVSGYTDAALDWWAKRIETWRCGEQPHDATCVTCLQPRRCRKRDVFVYFDNDVKVRAPFDAMNLARRLGIAMNTEQRAAPEVARISEMPRTRWPGIRRRSRAAESQS